LNIKCVFWFSLQFFLKQFSFYEEVREIWLKTYINLHTKYQLTLVGFSWNLNFLDRFLKKYSYQLSWK
jgi:hypothetical protein